VKEIISEQSPADVMNTGVGVELKFVVAFIWHYTIGAFTEESLHP
jgi:hypothetical protein